MSNRADLLAALQQARGLVATIEAALAEHDAAPEGAPAPARRLVDTSTAMKITGRSSSWLYALGRSHPELGWRLPSGSWAWGAEGLRLFMLGRVSAREENAAPANSANEGDSHSAP